MERSHISDRLLCLSSAMSVQEGVFSQLTVSISHLADTELNWTEGTLESRGQVTKSLLLLFIKVSFDFVVLSFYLLSKLLIMISEVYAN